MKKLLISLILGFLLIMPATVLSSQYPYGKSKKYNYKRYKQNYRYPQRYKKGVIKVRTKRVRMSRHRYRQYRRDMRRVQKLKRRIFSYERRFRSHFISRFAYRRYDRKIRQARHEINRILHRYRGYY